MIESICPNCGSKKVFDDDKVGKKYKCTTCENTVLIEKIDVAASTQEEVKLEVSAAPVAENKWKVKDTFGLAGFFLIGWIVCSVLDWSILGILCFILMLLSAVGGGIAWIIKKSKGN